MALNIPIPGLPGESFLKGVDTGSSMFSRLMQPVVQRENMQRQWREHMDNLALQKAAAGRAASLAPLQRRLAELNIQKAEMEADPLKKMDYMRQIYAGIKAMRAGQQGGMQGNTQEAMLPFQGMGMPSTQEIQNPTIQPPSKETIQNGLGGMNLSPDEQMMMSMAGIKIPKPYETPEQKFEKQKKLEEYKHELKQADRKEEAEFKNTEKRQKVMEASKKDLTHLDETLNALEHMKKIALSNPDLFGHSGILGFGSEGAAERFAKTTKNPNAGAWQTYGLAPIIEAESKMSAKGNILALKTALANKPNFSESQKTAISKLDTQIAQIKKRQEETRKLAGEQNNDDLSNLSDDELKKIIAGGK